MAVAFVKALKCFTPEAGLRPGCGELSAE